ncbi:MAG: hypothetical protein ACR2JH_00200, partial [Solirubrobacteraceae bacterium]
WSAQLAGQPLALVFASVTAAGFDGRGFDPAGFEPAKARRVLTSLRSLLRVAPLASPDRDLWFFDLRPFGVRLRRAYPSVELARLRQRTLHPVSTTCATGAVPPSNPLGDPALAPFTRIGRRTAADSVVVGLTGPPCPR